MQELIDKYIRKHCRIEGNVVYTDFKSPRDFNQRVGDIFNLKKNFRVQDWLNDNISNVIIMKYPTGRFSWYQDGKVHRLGAPAIEHINGSKSWCEDGSFHRLDGPARIDRVGNKTWYKNGKKHREGGPAIEYTNGTRHWYIDGSRHRLDGSRHRLDGPAVIRQSNLKIVERYYIKGRLYRDKDAFDSKVRLLNSP